MIDLRFAGLDADQADLAELVRDVTEASSTDHRVGAALGWASVGASESFGGSGGTGADRAVIAEAVGAALAADTSAWTAGVVAALLVRHGEPEFLSDLVGSFSAGALVAVPVGAPSAIASRLAGSHGALSGEFLAVGHADSDHVALPWRTAAGESMLVVDRGHRALVVEPVVSIDQSRPYSRVVVDGLEETDARARVSGADLFTDWLAHQCVVAALDAVGAARTSFARTLVYANERFQFGRAIGSFQAYKHRCADLFIEFRLAQSLAFRAARDLADGRRSAALAAGLASTSSATFVAGDAIQLHGGIGFTWEAGLHTNLKRSRADEIIAAAGGATARALLAHARDDDVADT